MAGELRVRATPIPGLLVLDLPVHRDSRGWFKENWQREKMVRLGLPDFEPVQNNVSFNASRGATRGIHTEPWDKLVSVAAGKVFAAWVDMRAGEGYGRAYWLELDPSTAAFVPRGVGNSYQALADGTVYSYLVNDHYVAGRTYPALSLDDPEVAIPWPIPLRDAEVSEKDQRNPSLSEASPMPERETLILGAEGQLGRALKHLYPTARALTRKDLDMSDPSAIEAWDWATYDVVLNAAAYTSVDAAEMPDGRPLAWAVNAAAPSHLARLSRRHRFTLVHVSSDYVFDGSKSEYDETAPFSPLGVYGQSKAAGDLAVATAPRHYILRTSWVVGSSPNFVKTMAKLASSGASPTVVADQVGRLTFTSELARAIDHLLRTGAPFGTYNCTGAGDPRSWWEYAREVFALCGEDPTRVAPVTTSEYSSGKQIAPRPASSVLSLAKLRTAGFEPEQVSRSLETYLRSEC